MLHNTLGCHHHHIAGSTASGVGIALALKLIAKNIANTNVLNFIFFILKLPSKFIIKIIIIYIVNYTRNATTLSIIFLKKKPEKIPGLF